MLLVFLTVSGVFFGLSASINTLEVCYGKRWQFPLRIPEQIQHIKHNGKALDPRFKVTPDSIYVSDVRKSDEGVYTVSLRNDNPVFVAKLKVLDCATKVTKDYFSTWEYSVPSPAEFLDFTPLHGLDQPKILWNSTDPEIRESRAQVKNNTWEMSHLTRADSGYYSFRDEDHSVVARVLLKVKGITLHYKVKENKRFLIAYPSAFEMWAVTFTPEGEKEPRTRMIGNRIIKDNWFIDRIQALTQGIEIYPVETTDSGTFEFRDPEGNVVLTVQLEVIEGSKSQTIMTAVIASVAVMVIVCCCCCCKKKCCKKDKSAPQTADSPAPAVYYHNENQPQTSSQPSEQPPPYLPYKPVNSHVPDQPTATSPELPTYHEVSIHVNPPEPEVAPAGRPSSTPGASVRMDFLSSDVEPQFELKGVTVPSAPPLSSNSSSTDVYHSEKLNFL